MIKTVSAYEARTNFGELINLAYYNGYEVIVERMGKPMVKIIKADISKEDLKKKALRLAGVWKENKEIEKNMREFRKNFRLIRHVSI